MRERRKVVVMKNMVLHGVFWREEDGFWYISMPKIDLMTQTLKKDDISEMISDAIVMVSGDDELKVDVSVEDKGDSGDIKVSMEGDSGIDILRGRISEN